MKLLIITQSVDKNNPVLGFFHGWITEFAKKFEFITVICLEKGEYDLPSNVKVLSLGKEQGASRIKYLWNFYKYIWQERKNYDAVFVHMNQEYVLFGWKIWWLFGKKVYMWRNHHSGGLLTRWAVFFSKKVFCTSMYSFTAKYKKAVIMPVGVDTSVFCRQDLVERKKNSILFLGRIAPVKRPDMLIDALSRIKDADWSATIVGDALPEDADYYTGLVHKVKDLGLENRIVFRQGIPNTETSAIYNAHEIFINLSPSGMYDKTIFEAIACGCLVLASNENLRGQISDDIIFMEGDRTELQEKLLKLLVCSEQYKEEVRIKLSAFAKMHSLNYLADRLYNEMSS